MAFHVKRSLSGGGYAFVTNSNNVKTAIVYVHGFLGDPQSTWEQLQYYIDRLPGEPFRDCDLYFYDYSAEQNFVQVSAVHLREFLNEIFPLPDSTLIRVHLSDLDWRLQHDLEVVTLREHSPYSHLVLVGHSLGAVVIRRLIADEALTAEVQPVSRFTTELLDSEVVLMAPAHLGFEPSGRTALLHLLPFSTFFLLAAPVFRAFSELQPGCHSLTQLQSETARMATCFPSSRALRPRILWGETENVVVLGRFDTDPPGATKYAKGKDHVSVSKLQANYLTPAEIVVLRELAHGA